MRILVTGATGFVGTRVVSALTDAGHEVVAVGGLRSSTQNSVDVASPTSVETLRSIGGVDAIVHTASLAHRFAKVTEAEFRSVNVHGVENIANLAAALGARHFLLFSSTLVYGRRRDKTVVITEDMECRPEGIYGRSKLDGEYAAQRVCEQKSIDLTIFRASPIVGEGSKGNFARLIEAIDKRRFVMLGDGLNRKSLIYVGDVARAAVAVVARGGDKTQVFNVTGEATTMRELVRNIHESLGQKAVLPFAIPAGPAKFMIDSAAKVLRHDRLSRISATLDTWLSADVYSKEKFETMYNFKSETDIATAIKLETAYYLRHK
ncbi:MAG: NAD-dependent epimerase/dehydratase family protein [Pyrinomonadaceae bacterium]